MADDMNLSDAFPDGWRPEEGDTLVGPVVDIAKAWSDQSQSFYPIVIIHDEVRDEDVAVHGFHFVLKEKFLELKPRVGERMGIKMGAKIPLKSNPSQSVQTYTVKIEGREAKAEDVWSDITAPRVQQQSAQLASSVSATTVANDEDIPF